MIYQPAASPWHRPLGFDWFVLAGLLTAAAFLVLLVVRGLGLYGLVLVCIAVGAIAAVRHPLAAVIFMVAFASVNRFVIMLAFHYTGSIAITKAVELWKEGVLAVLIVRVIWDLLFTPDRSHTVKLMDILVLGFIGVCVAYLLYPGPLDTDVFTRLQGFRTDATFMFAYWVGRGVHIHRRELRWILLSIVPGSLLVGLVAIWQIADPSGTNRIFDQLGYADFAQFQGVIGAPEAIRSRALPGAVTLPRAGSLVLSDLSLAFYQLLLVSMATALYGLSKRAVARVAAGAFLAMMLATLVLTATRSAIASGAGTVVALGLVSRSAARVAMVGVAMVAAGLVLLQTGFINANGLQALTNFQDPSSQQHAFLLGASLDALRAEPMGRGLGTAGVVSQTQLRGGESFTNESWYLQLGTEMGVLGMGTYVLLVAGILGLSLFYFFTLRDFWLRALTLTVAGTAGAMLVSGSFLHAWENTPLSMIFWLFAGLAVRSRDLEAWPGYLERP